jgi:L-aspartate oxidase
MTPTYDYIIVGSGIAGLYAALLAREHGSVLVLTKGSIDDCNTRWAQGGIAAPIGAGDSPDIHLHDTLDAGAGLVDEEAARVLTGEAADRIQDLVRLGVPFDTVHGEIALAREGAHSVARVLHAGGDSTGQYIELTLSSVARHEGVTVLENTIATSIAPGANGVRPGPAAGRAWALRFPAHPSAGAGRAESEGGRKGALGVRALHTESGEVNEYSCRHLVLATGGAGQLFRVSTNPEVATGDGIALAYRAGAEVMDMEFFQFHPTALRLPGVQAFLISEAVRGEGGVLRDVSGERFMPEYHPKAELAPRDIVARAILDRMHRTKADHVLLDVTHLDPRLVLSRFPQIYRFCKDAGLDITAEPIPVSPAAHYTMGGIRTNTWGETTIPGLYACGECACTGVHGANRLASNSLLETVVFAKRVVRRTVDSPDTATPETPDAVDLSEPVRGDCPPLDREAIQSLMWQDVGIVRDASSMSRAKSTLSAWHASLGPPRDRASQEVADLLVCGRLVTEAALLREESRGAHYRTDFPQPREEWRRHIVFRLGAG